MSTRQHSAVGSASPRTTANAAGHGPGPETQTRGQRSASAQRTYRWRQSPQRDCEEMSSRFGTAASEVAPGISRSDRATSNPSIRSSPWILDAPHSGFSLLIRRMRSRNSRSIFGRPALCRDFQRQKALNPEERCLSLPQIKSACTDGAVHQAQAAFRCARRTGCPSKWAHPCLTIDACAPRCNTPCNI